MEVALLIVGGGPAAMEAARGYRDAGGAGSVLMVADEHRAPYRRPPLTKDLIRGEAAPSSLPMETEDWFHTQDVELARTRVTRLSCEAVDPSLAAVDQAGGTERPSPPAVAAAGRHAWLEDGRVVAYEQLILATGSAPTRLPVVGADLPGVHTIRTARDVDGFLERLGAGRPVAVIGSGFIGCEIAASLRLRGHPVTLLSDEDAPLVGRLGPEVGARIAGWLEGAGVELRLGAPVEEIAHGTDARDGESFCVLTAAGPVVADLVVMAAGATPRLELAADLTLDVSQGGLPVDASMRTARTGIYAAGDAARPHHPVAGRAIQTEHWGDALAQGEVAGRAAAGDATAAWDDIPGFWSTIGERTLKYAAWGDGHDQVEVVAGDGEAFVASYFSGGRLVGVLTHGDDATYDLAADEIRAAAGG